MVRELDYFGGGNGILISVGPIPEPSSLDEMAEGYTLSYLSANEDYIQDYGNRLFTLDFSCENRQMILVSDNMVFKVRTDDHDEILIIWMSLLV